MKKVITLLSCLSLCLIGNFLFPAFVSAHPTGAKTSTITTSSHITSHALRPNAGDPSLAGRSPDDRSLGCWDSNARVISRLQISTDAGDEPIHPVLIAEWFSPDCGTNWADVQILDGAQITMQATISKVRNNDGTFNIDGGAPFEASSIVTTSRLWSPMVYSPHDLAQACGGLTPDAAPCADPA